MSGAIHLLPIYAFTAWTGETLPLLYESEATYPRPSTVEFYVHVTVHRNKFLYNKTKQMHQFPKFTPA
jgi:hypothetical protein